MKLLTVDFVIKLYGYFEYTIKDLIQNPKYFTLQKLGRFHLVRHWVTQRRESRFNPNIQFLQPTVFKDIDVMQVVDTLHRDGIYSGFVLPNTVLQEIQSFVFNTECFGERNPQQGFLYHQYPKIKESLNKEFTMARYYNVVEKCLTMQKLKQDSTLLKVAAHYLKSTPVFFGATIAWNFRKAVPSSPLQLSKAAQVFHCDIDDFRGVRFFFYLTDVDENSGPHVYIKGSHQKKKFVNQLMRGRASEESLLKYYDSQNVLSLCGPAGWGFAEDSFGYHKGTPPFSQDRLLLVLKFVAFHPGKKQDEIDPNTLKLIPNLG